MKRTNLADHHADSHVKQQRQPIFIREHRDKRVPPQTPKGTLPLYEFN